MQAKEAIRLLICSQSSQEAETVTSLLRNSGHSTRANLVQNLSELKTKLNEHTWDICLCHLEMNGLTGKQVINEIQGQGLDLPTVYVHDEVDSIHAEKSLKAGAVDLVPSGEYNHILKLYCVSLKTYKCVVIYVKPKPFYVKAKNAAKYY